ncbi:MAG: hypothetical protein E7637_08060 [Ruminococcaceae bacterium]|nr:hypothetical protein [Oscillospiraceae bacterium]
MSLTLSKNAITSFCGDILPLHLGFDGEHHNRLSNADITWEVDSDCVAIRSFSGNTAVSHSTCGMAIDINAKAIVACSLSGMTARMVSRFRAPVEIIGLTTNEKTWRKLALSWGVTPAMCETFTSTDVLFYTAKKIASKELGLTKKDKIVITGGDTTGHSGNTNLIKIDEI